MSSVLKILNPLFSEQIHRSAATLDRLLWVTVNLCLTLKILFMVANNRLV